MDDQQPWSGERWLTEVTFRSCMKDNPELDEEQTFKLSVKCSAMNWPLMNAKKKEKFLLYASMDKEVIRVVPDIRPFFISGQISGFICRISG